MNPIYLFEFINGTTLESVTFISADTSAYPQRYNRFQVTLNTLQDPLNAVVWLDKGQHYYNVFEQVSTTNLDPLLSDRILEQGLMKVNFTNVTAKPSFDYVGFKPSFNG